MSIPYWARAVPRHQVAIARTAGIAGGGHIMDAMGAMPCRGTLIPSFEGRSVHRDPISRRLLPAEHAASEPPCSQGCQHANMIYGQAIGFSCDGSIIVCGVMSASRAFSKIDFPMKPRDGFRRDFS